MVNDYHICYSVHAIESEKKKNIMSRVFSESKESGPERVLLQIFKNSLCYFSALSFSQREIWEKLKVKMYI